MLKYFSVRVKRTPQDQLKDDRYQYLNLEQAEPNLSDQLIVYNFYMMGRESKEEGRKNTKI